MSVQTSEIQLNKSTQEGERTQIIFQEVSDWDVLSPSSLSPLMSRSFVTPLWKPTYKLQA